ncbi:glycosyltransferase family 1 protein [Corynebacterium sp. sy017]|uniref:glycosyltransferase family 4 protein n=1 Tax=unclassified Corynebacterium TaxID=2624378 RepID=UPI001184E91F|nr:MULTISPECIES: glycosyltransferase family 4 protein [unclassified Corynebacterium]MBP3087728.1 glycosyltransferase family 1 protein [Corynebacterium sp. sy017]TSD92280.1 glycosyltransferase family 1 protein [Corynebacterium sp. SY003]
MKIGIVCPYSFDEPGGVQAHILDLAQKLISIGHQVSVIGPAYENTDLPDFVVPGGKSFPIKYNGSVARLSFGFSAYRRMRAFLKNGNFDVLHIHEPNSPSYSLLALLMSKDTIVATYHTSSSGSRVLKLFLPVLRGSLEKIRGGIAVSEMARRWQVEQLGGDSVLIPNGVDTSVFGRAYELAQDKKNNAQSEKIEIVFLGRIDEPRKGLDILLRAIEMLFSMSQRYQEKIQVTVIGAGTPRDLPGVDFVGKVSDEQKAAILGRADIYVAPNTGGESFGIVLVEAMAAGCAVVASDLEAFAAVCNAKAKQPAGILFENENSSELAQKLALLIDDESLRQRYITAGLERARIYDWDNVVEKVLRVYETVTVSDTRYVGYDAHADQSSQCGK